MTGREPASKRPNQSLGLDLWSWTALTLSLAVHACFIAATRFRGGGTPAFTLIDDAMISMRYAHNLASGNGLTWNPGEAPVEGYTNPLWVLLMSLFHLAAGRGTPVVLLVMGTSAVLLLLGGVAAAGVLSRLGGESPVVRAFTIFATATYYPLVYWSLRGMETGLVFLVLVTSVWIAFLFFDREARSGHAAALGALLAIGYLTRPDSMVALLLVGLCASVYAVRALGKTSLLAIWLPLAAVVATHLLWRRSYYGDVLPLTYYLKVEGVTAWERLQVGWRVSLVTLEEHLAPVLLVGIAAFALLSRHWKKVALLGGVFVLGLLYSIYVGGDYAEGQAGGANRYVLPGVPLLLICIAAAFERLPHRLASLSNQRRGAARVLAALVCLGAVCYLSVPLYARHFREGDVLLRADLARLRTALLIRRLTDLEALVAAHACGQIGYYSDRRIVDLLGKSDPVVAKGPPAAPFRPGHNKWNYEYSIGERQPDVVADIWGSILKYVASSPLEYVELYAPGGFAKEPTMLLKTGSPHVKWNDLSKLGDQNGERIETEKR